MFDLSATEGWVTKGQIGYDGAAGVWKMSPFKKRKLYQFIYYSVIAGPFIYYSVIAGPFIYYSVIAGPFIY